MTDRTVHHPSRRAALALVAALAAPRPALAMACDPPTVLLVCPAGSVKSAIAREVLKARAAARGVGLTAVSRGVTPADHVSPALAAHLKADGIDPATQPLRRFEPADAARADVVIAFDEAAALPALRNARVWTTPSWNEDYPAARAALAPQVEALLDELAARGCPRG
jgi:protein-tyrosine-phosphatase